MAQLPGGEWLIQMVGSEVILLRRHTEEEIARFGAGDPNEVGRGMKLITESPLLDTEQKAFACFWAGYFYGCARHSG
jgi:hypothetical protein